MNKEEKKQIKDFEYWVNTNNEKGVCLIPDYICNRVLNLIDKQQKEIDKMQKELDLDGEAEIALNNRIIDLEVEIDKQNKVIDEIYNAFYEFVDRCPGSGMKLLKENGFDIDKCDKCNIKNNNINCKDCIKQYFIRKVEENDKD